MMRKTTAFEKLLLIIGLGVVLSGIYFVNQLLVISGGVITTDVLIGIVLWLLLIFVLIICAIAENAREELGLIMQENAQEVKLLRDIATEQIEEIRLLREIFQQGKKK